MPAANAKIIDNPRQGFSTAELTQIFSVKQYQQDQYRHPFHYWLMLIGLYTGARLNEICQLCVSDIYTKNNILVFDFNQNHPPIKRKSLKSTNYARLVPVHSTLINLNLTQFVSDQTQGSPHDRLFPELKWQERGGYGKRAEQWFNETLKKECGIITKHGRAFHIFRATVISHLMSTTGRQIVTAIAGHDDRKTSSILSSADIVLPELQAAIQTLNFGSSLQSVKPYHASNITST